MLHLDLFSAYDKDGYRVTVYCDTALELFSELCQVLELRPAYFTFFHKDQMRYCNIMNLYEAATWFSEPNIDDIIFCYSCTNIYDIEYTDFRTQEAIELLSKIHFQSENSL